MCEAIIKQFFILILDIKMYHWTTKCYSRHKASGKYFDKLLENIDSFIEVYIGKYKRPTAKTMSIVVNTYNDKEIVNLLKSFSQFLTKDITKMLSSNDTDLLTIRDNILEDTHQTMYLFTFN